MSAFGFGPRTVDSSCGDLELAATAVNQVGPTPTLLTTANADSASGIVDADVVSAWPTTANADGAPETSALSTIANADGASETFDADVVSMLPTTANADGAPEPVDADDLMQRLQPTLQRHADSIMVRIVDHACAGPASISARLKATCEASGLQELSATLRADQAPNACGHIDAEVVVMLRNFALSPHQWLLARLPPYDTRACVRKCNAVLNIVSEDAHELVTEEVNTLGACIR